MPNSSTTRGWFWVAAQALLLAMWMLALLLGVPWIVSDGTRQVIQITGLLLAVGGVGLAFTAASHLGPNLTPTPHPRRSASLVTTGIYAHARHPIYGGIILIVIGVTAIFLAPPAVLFALLLVIFFILKSIHEERLLCERFAEYQEYARTRKRFVPWVV